MGWATTRPSLLTQAGPCQAQSDFDSFRPYVLIVSSLHKEITYKIEFKQVWTCLGTVYLAFNLVKNRRRRIIFKEA